MSKFHQRGDQYVSKYKLGSLDEEYLTREEMASTRKAIMKYKLRDPGPSIYSKRKNKIKQ
jgi:hypothetical protein